MGDYYLCIKLKCLILVAVCFASPAGATQYFVSPSGSDLNSGLSSDSPLKKISAALRKADPGDDVLLMPGVFLGKTFIYDIHGEPEHAITITSLSSDSSHFAVIDGGAQPAYNMDKYGFYLERVSWLTFRNLKFRNCWTDVIVMKDSRYISVIGCQFKGGRRVIYPRYKGCHHFLIESCEWEQDERVYTTFNWDELHHGDLQYYNGSLFGSKEIDGGFVIRNNTIINAFNGIRFKGDKGNRRQNANGEIYGNVIVNTRDNALEPEDVCSNLHIYHNAFINSHAHISIDMIRGGPIYFYGNRGWQSENRGHEWTIFKFRGLEDGTTAMLDEPFHVFNNSWYVYFDAFGGSSGEWENRYLKHHNNAYYFLSDADLGVTNWGDGYAFDYDCSNSQFPESILSQGFETNGIVEDPLFMDKENGDLRLAGGSPCVDAGTVLAFPEFDWIQEYVGSGTDIGAYENNILIEGPPFRFKEPPGGCYYVEKPRIVRHKVSAQKIILYFSVELDPLTVNEESIQLFQNGSRAEIIEIGFPDNDYELHISTSDFLSEDQLSARMDPLPTGKNGETMTFWASTIDYADDAGTSDVAELTPPGEFGEIELKIYPNPFNGSAKLTISRNTPGSGPAERLLKTTVAIFDVRGRMVDLITTDDNDIYQLNSQKLTSGVYFAVVRFASMRATTKFLVVR